MSVEYYKKEKIKLSLKLYNYKRLPQEDVHGLIEIFNDFLNISFAQVQKDLSENADENDSKISISDMKLFL